MKYRSLQHLMNAKDNGKVPEGFLLILDSDSVHSTVMHSTGNEHEFRSDPDSLLREALTYLGIEFDEA